MVSAATDPPTTLTGGVPMVIATLWAVAIGVFAASGAFVVPPGGLPAATLAAIAGPPVLFLLAWRMFVPVRDWVSGLDLALVTALQITRTLGLVFVVLWTFGELPAVFAFPAGFGDALVALAAIPVTLAVARRAPGWRGASYALVIAGFADFLLAVATGVLSGPGRALAFDGAPPPDLLQQLPMVMIPGFAVPLFLILHLIVLIRLRTGD